MGDSLRFVGRMGKLRNVDTLVAVDSYETETGEYYVKFLGENDESVHRVKSSEVDFPGTASDFMDRFPNPTHFLIQDKLEASLISANALQILLCMVESCSYVGLIGLWGRVTDQMMEVSFGPDCLTACLLVP